MKKIIIILAAAVLSVCVLSAQENVQNILPLQANEFSSLMSGEVLSQDNEGGTDVTKFVPKGSLLAKNLHRRLPVRRALPLRLCRSFRIRLHGVR
jgi:hypothetical protein